MATRELDGSPSMLRAVRAGGRGDDPGRVEAAVRRRGRRRRRDVPDLDPAADRRRDRPRPAGRLQPGVWVRPARRGPGDLSAHPGLPAPALADDRLELPVPGHRARAHRQPDHPAPADPRHRAPGDRRAGDAGRGPPPRQAVLADLRGPRRRRAGLGGGLDQPQARATATGPTPPGSRCSRAPRTCRRPPPGRSPGIWGGATARCLAT